ncbi:hypothetical protein [Gemmobacter serpentinus]|uniref:hypothetical protein n=1 Tax=Gemmobacter serpentinus TaxID=2652247 RepID=UPI00124F6E7E|nr:hypothetical protein [Gemmobacter serpentinus]
MSEAELEAHERNLTPDEQDDYIQEGVFAKELAAWLEAGLRQAGLNPDDNYAADFGRVLLLQAPSGGKVMVTCCNYDEADATEDGLSHIVGVKAQPGFKARFFHDPALQAFNDKIAAAIGQMIDATPEIKRVREN